jgi:hypothetical protein
MVNQPDFCWHVELVIGRGDGDQGNAKVSTRGIPGPQLNAVEVLFARPLSHQQVPARRSSGDCDPGLTEFTQLKARDGNGLAFPVAVSEPVAGAVGEYSE